jgi:hypothetical protein
MSKTLAAISAWVAVWALGASAVRAATLPTLRTGTYVGTITDPDGVPDIYTATIRITARRLRPHRRAGTVRYSEPANDTTFVPALSCRGTLTFLRRSGRRFSFRERIAGGGGAQCISGGTVTLTRRTSRTFTYRWTKRGFTDPAPTGRLTRRH